MFSSVLSLDSKLLYGMDHGYISNSVHKKDLQECLLVIRMERMEKFSRPDFLNLDINDFLDWISLYSGILSWAL